MTTNSPPSTRSEPAESSPTLTDRVAERVEQARLALEEPPKASSAELQEIQSLKRVFREMGHSYRRYRSQVGGPVVPGLRDAAYGFRANPSLPALVAVAAYLDELDLLS
jgi:hypothetical protein